MLSTWFNVRAKGVNADQLVTRAPTLFGSIETILAVI
jgi:hypothetical protein